MSRAVQRAANLGGGGDERGRPPCRARRRVVAVILSILLAGLWLGRRRRARHLGVVLEQLRDDRALAVYARELQRREPLRGLVLHRLAVPCARVHVGSGAEQQPRNLSVAALGRDVKRCA